MFSFGYSCGKRRRDSENLEDVLLFQVFYFAHISSPYIFQARVYRTNARSITHLYQAMETIQVLQKVLSSLLSCSTACGRKELKIVNR